MPAELLHEGWFAEIGPAATAVLSLLAIAADRRGASYFGRNRMAAALGMSRHDVDTALHRLLDAGLADFRPWRDGGSDGVWQVLPPPPRQPALRAERVLSIADVLRSLGYPEA